ncbi:MAG: DUF6508 domain-containing protein [Candidatus Saccharimonadaceae bacterium]
MQPNNLTADDDTTNIQRAVTSFKNLNNDALAQLQNLNTRIQAHTGPWGELKGGDKDENGIMQMPYWMSDPLINELVTFIDTKGIEVRFDWSSWDEGRDWYKDTNEAKYSNLDVETALKLLTSVIRNNRYSDGALVSAFNDGNFPKIINWLAMTSPVVPVVELLPSMPEPTKPSTRKIVRIFLGITIAVPLVLILIAIIGFFILK